MFPSARLLSLQGSAYCWPKWFLAVLTPGAFRRGLRKQLSPTRDCVVLSTEVLSVFSGGCLQTAVSALSTTKALHFWSAFIAEQKHFACLTLNPFAEAVP